MGQLTPALASALAEVRPLLFGAVEINLPDYDLLLLDGSAEIMVGDRKFVGKDDIFGTIESISKIKDGGGESAPVLTLTLLPASDGALATLANAQMQGSPVLLRMGVVNRITGLVVPDPYLLFSGELDVPTIKWGQNSQRLEYKIISVFDRFFQVEEGRRLASSFHRWVWPDETGMDDVTDVELPQPWGEDMPNPWVQTRTDNPAIGVITTLKT